MSDVRKSLGRPERYALVLTGLYLTYLVIGPFLVALTWAVLFAILFHGMQTTLTRRIGPKGAALVTTLVVAVAVVAPGALLVSALAHEVPQISEFLKRASEDAPRQIEQIWDAARTRGHLPLPDDPTELMTSGAQRALAYVAPRAGSLIAYSFATLGNLVAMLFALFFLLRDGETMSRQLRDRLPFSEADSERLMSGARDLVTASIGASVIVAAAQGTIAGLAFWLLGMRAPVFWGVVTSFCSLLPVVGATVVWVPAGIGLLLSGEIMRGVMMLLIGVFGISMVDNVLRPLLLTGKTSVSGLIIFFGLLGGAAAFGLIGLVIGPIILVLTGQMLDLLRRPTRMDESAAADDVHASASVADTESPMGTAAAR